MNIFRRTEPVVDITYPDAEWLEAHKPNGFTYDAWRLESSEYQLLFVYDQLQERHRASCLLKPYADRICTAFTKTSNWSLWKKTLGRGSFPIPLRTPFTMVERARIKGELWKVQSNRIIELDEYKSNGVEFRRKRVELLVPYKHKYQIVNKDHNYEEGCDEAVATVQAWMYVGRLKYWADHLDAGFQFKLTQVFEPKGLVLPGKYYAFTPLEYNE